MTDQKTPPATDGVFSRQRKCTKCTRELVNENGVHMGIPFGRWTYSKPPMLVCAKCYDELTTDEHHVQRTGDETI